MSCPQPIAVALAAVTTHVRSLSRAAVTRFALTAVLSLVGATSVSAQDLPSRPMEFWSLNFRAINRTANTVTITRVESVDASGKTTSWSMGDRGPRDVAQGASVQLSITAPARDMTAAEQEAIMATIRGSVFRITVRSNGATRVITHAGRSAKRTANGLTFDDFIMV